MRLIIASNNAKKRKEIEAIAQPLGIEIVPADETQFVEVVEDGVSFAENARKKAVAFAQANALPALADDSGLCVAALDDRPGVWSSRYAGESASDSENNAKLLAEMAGKAERAARFVCALCFYDPTTGQELTASGETVGVIIDKLCGNEGFGYDPLFYSPELGKSFAEATASQKASVSHRGRALRQMATLLANWHRNV